MPTKTLVKYFIYALVIILSLIVLTLIMVSPAGFTDSKSVYQGF
jgi:hypothetical protein